MELGVTEAGTRVQEDAWELPATAVGDRFSRPARGGSLRRRLGLREIAAADPTTTLAIEEGQPRKQTLVREGLHRRALIAADVIAAALAMTITWYLAGVHVRPIVFAALPAVMLMNKAAGLYDRDELVLHKTTLEDTPALLQISGLLALGVWLALGQFTAVDLTRAEVVLLWIVSLSLMLTGRVVARAVARRLATTERCVVIGDAASIATVTAKLASSGAKADVVATIELRPSAPNVDARTFCTLVDRHRVDRVIVGPLASDPVELLEVIRVAKAIGLRVSLIPRLFEVIGSAVAFDELDGLTILGVPRAGLGRSSRFLKRSFDLAGATIGIVLLAPLMAAIAIAIRVDSPGPVLFRQVRVGRDGKRFCILKFRSMVCQAEALKPAVSHLNVAQGVFKIPCDPRLTRVGRWLRRRCLDELPQLFNVWRGEMSLVGPRPLVVDEDAKILGLDRARLALTPGMTGHWQVLGSARIPMQEMVAIDYLYAANWSLWNDVKLLLRTIRLVFSGAGV
jgi:exopolysaccharide biosynthesis polyprenyl glycosylphosphotransferase